MTLYECPATQLQLTCISQNTAVYYEGARELETDSGITFWTFLFFFHKEKPELVGVDKRLTRN